MRFQHEDSFTDHTWSYLVLPRFNRLCCQQVVTRLVSIVFYILLPFKTRANYLPLSELLYDFFFTVHPCDKDTKGGCDQICNKDGDDAVCACMKGYETNDGGKTCTKSKSLFFEILLGSLFSRDAECVLEQNERLLITVTRV